VLCLSLFQERCRKEISHQVQVLHHHPIFTEFDGQWIDASLVYGEDKDSSDEEMANSKFVGDTSLGASEFHSLLADTASRRKLKAKEAFTAPFRFLFNYADQSYEHMSFIENKLEILKGEIASSHEKSQQMPEH
jgi:hypothetical protein